MPGLTGFVSGSTVPGAAATDALQRAIAAQVHEPEYRHRLLTLPAGGAVAAIDTGTEPGRGYVHRVEEPSSVVAWIGYLHEPAPAADPAGRVLARRLAASFATAGPEALRDFDGSFVLFIHDAARRRSILAVDHCASRPAFWCVSRGNLLFAPEPRGLLEMLPDRPAVATAGIASFLVNGHLLADDSFFDGIVPLLPGQYICFENGAARTGNWWQHRFEPSDDDPGEYVWADQLADLLRNAVQRAADRSGSFILPLSGGFDSRGILGCLLESFPPDSIPTVTWGVDDGAEGSDAHTARLLAHHVGVPHRFMRRDASRMIDDVGPMIERSQGLTSDPCVHHGELRIMQSLRRDAGADAILRGDECFGFGGEASTDTEALRRVAIGQLAALPSLHPLFRSDVLPDALEAYGGRLASIIDACPHADPLDRKDWFYFTQRLTHYLNRSSYYKQTVLEVINPWLDRPVLEFIGRVPRHYRIDKMLYRRTLERCFPRLFEVPMADRHSLEDWSATVAANPQLRAFMTRHLIHDRNGFHEFFDPAKIGVLLEEVVKPIDWPTWRKRATGAAKKALSRWPALYRRLKTSMIDRVPLPAPPAGETLLRLLQLKLWFDSGAGGAGQSANAAQRHGTPASSASAP